jgi:hypothetical protein
VLIILLFFVSSRHVIGVINKFDDDPHEEFDEINTFEQFKEAFLLTRERGEREFFARHFPQLSLDVNVSTKAVVHAMDRIFFQSFDRCIEDGLQKIQQMIANLGTEMRRESAPSPLVYHSYTEVELAATPVAYQGIDMKSIWNDFKEIIVKKELISLFSSYQDKELYSLASTLNLSSVSEQEWSNYYRGPFSAAVLLAPEDYKRFHQQKKIFHEKVVGFAMGLLDHFNEFILQEIYSNGSSTNSLFQKQENSLFHRVKRFPALIQSIKNSLKQTSLNWKLKVKTQLTNYLEMIWNYEGTGKDSLTYQRIQEILRKEIPKILFKNFYLEILESLEMIYLSYSNNISNAESVVSSTTASVTQNLLQEDPEFTSLRLKYEKRFISLKQQEMILLECRHSTSHEELKRNLLHGEEKLKNLLENHDQDANPWLLEFWSRHYYGHYPRERASVEKADMVFQSYLKAYSDLSVIPTTQLSSSSAKLTDAIDYSSNAVNGKRKRNRDDEEEEPADSQETQDGEKVEEEEGWEEWKGPFTDPKNPNNKISPFENNEQEKYFDTKEQEEDNEHHMNNNNSKNSQIDRLIPTNQNKHPSPVKVIPPASTTTMTTVNNDLHANKRRKGVVSDMIEEEYHQYHTALPFPMDDDDAQEAEERRLSQEQQKQMKDDDEDEEDSSDDDRTSLGSHRHRQAPLVSPLLSPKVATHPTSSTTKVMPEVKLSPPSKHVRYQEDDHHQNNNNNNDSRPSEEEKKSNEPAANNNGIGSPGGFFGTIFTSVFNR